MEMNDKQRQLVEDNLKLVRYIINKEFPRYRGDEDMFQIGSWGLCKAAMGWDESKGTFSTFAYRCVRNEINLEIRNRCKQVPTISLDTPIEENLTLEDMLGGGDDTDATEVSVDAFKKVLTSEELVIFNLKASGHKIKEIMDITGYTQGEVRSILRNIRQKYLKLQ